LERHLGRVSHLTPAGSTEYGVYKNEGREAAVQVEPLHLQWPIEEDQGRPKDAVNTKGHPSGMAFCDANAGDYLISHTLSRAVPSARRGLTSVFGMGTGVTLAVCSPASCDAALGGSFPTAISLYTRAVSPRNEIRQTGATNLHLNELHWACYLTALKACC
jgi:hypothetical protein